MEYLLCDCTFNVNKRIELIKDLIYQMPKHFASTTVFTIFHSFLKKSKILEIQVQNLKTEFHWILK